MPQKEDLLNDINIIVTTSSKHDMSIPSNAEKFMTYYKQKGVFRTSVGKQYLERLFQISKNEDSSICFICKKNPSHDRVLCEACMKKYSRGEKTFFNAQEKDEITVLNELFEGTNNAPVTQKNKPYENNAANNSNTKETPKQGMGGMVLSIIAGIIVFIIISNSINGSNVSKGKKEALEEAAAKMAQEYAEYEIYDVTFNTKIIYEGRHAGSDNTSVIVAVEPSDGAAVQCYDYTIYKDGNAIFDSGSAYVYSPIDSISDEAIDQLKKMFKYAD